MSAVIVMSLGLGIGVNTVVFCWIEARLLTPMPGVSNGSRVQLVEARNDAGMYPGSSWLEYRDLRESLRTIPDLIAFRSVPAYVGEPRRAERMFGMFVSDNYFTALGLTPAAGRFFRPDEVRRPGGDPVAVISYGHWQSRFGSGALAGRTVRVNGIDLTIAGVAPREFQGTVLGLDFDVWMPATLAPAVAIGSRELEDRGIRGYSLMGRLAPGTSADAAQAELDGAMAQLGRVYPRTNGTMRGEVLPFSQSPRGPQRLLTTALAILQAMMLLLLLAVCGNMANLVLARASARQREVGVRLALGAAPWRIASLLLTENVLLGLGGAFVGALVAFWGVDTLILLPLSGLPIRFQTPITGLTLGFAMLLGVLAGLVVGAVPAIHLARLNPLTAFRAGVRSSGRSRLRNTLMAAQVALAIVVLIAAGVFLQRLRETRDDPGFRRDGVLLAAYDLTGRNAPASFTRTFAPRLLERLRAMPSIEAAAISSSVPLDIHGLPSRVFTVEGHTRPDDGFDQALANTVTPGYFDLLDVPFLAGSDFADLIDAASPPQVVINDAFVREYLDGRDAVGRRLDARGRTYVIAGVVRTSISNAFGEDPAPCLYFSYRDTPASSGEIHVRARGGDPAALANDVRRAVAGIDPELPVFNVRTLEDHIETNLVFRRVPARFFAIVGPLLIALAAIGIHAVVDYSASLRMVEVGVRMALGATTRRVVAGFVLEHLAVIAAGGVLGWLAAFVVAIDLIPGGAIDPLVFAGVPALLLVVAVGACWRPAHRAARVDPSSLLRL
jgi:predicted permease